MAKIQVWAPIPQKLEIECAGRRTPLQRDDRGRWTAEVPELTHGVDYSLWLDEEGPIPDPRSPWQPEGPDGPSRWVDHTRFDWQHEGFRQAPLREALIYELHIGTFTAAGTFEAAIERLDYLAGLGVTHVELMPVAEAPGLRGWGYDGVDLYAPHHGYGGPEGLKRLVDACHARGMAVLLDVVYNHLGPAGNYLWRFGPYFAGHYKTPWGDAMNLDRAGSEQVRRFFIDNALMWLRDYRIDGLRLDAVHAFLDMSAMHFLEQLSHNVRELEAQTGRECLLIAESDLNDVRLMRTPEQGGCGLDAQWSDDFHHSLHTLLTGERGAVLGDFGRVADLARCLREGFVYQGQYSNYRHRRHGRTPRGMATWRFIVCIQNHDQIGNRAKGERLGQIVTPQRVRIAAALTLLSPFVPMLFMGEEWGATSPFQYFTDHRDEALGEAIRQGRRREFAAFGWDPDEIPDPQAEDAFLVSGLLWEECEVGEHAALLDWYRGLIALRKRLPELKDGRMELTRVAYDEEKMWLTMRRGALVVAINFGDAACEIKLGEPAYDHAAAVLSSPAGATSRQGRLNLEGLGVAVFTPSA